VTARPRLVVLRALGLGDLLAGLPALRALARALDDHERVLLAPAALADLARHAVDLDRVVHVPRDAGLGKGGPPPPLPAAASDPDLAVNLHGSGPGSHRLLLGVRPARLWAFVHPEVRAGTGAGALEPGPAWEPDEHEAARWCRLVEHFGVPAGRDDLDIAQPDRPVPPQVQGATLIHPGAAAPARRWPPARWAAVARAEVARRRDVVVTGGPDEERLVAAVVTAAGLPATAGLAGPTGPPSALDLAAVLAAAGRVVCGDTGVAHLATAVGTPSVVLFGPTPPSRWGPPGRSGRHRVLWTGRDGDEPGDPHATTADPRLLEIGVEAVVAALAGLPERSGARG
jgi:ADP-heptose:LPS heptosyltransferase